MRTRYTSTSNKNKTVCELFTLTPATKTKLCANSLHQHQQQKQNCVQTRYTNTSNKNKTVCELVTLTPAQGGLGIPNLTTEAPQQYSASKISTKQYAESIKFQSEIMNTNLQLVEELKRDLRTLKAENTKSKIESIDVSLNPELLRLTQQARDKGASSWLNAIPLKDQGLTLNKQKFRDFLRLRYNLPLQDLPSTRACGEPFDVSHGLSCKKGGGGGGCGSTP